MGGRYHQLNSAIVRAALAIVRSFSSPGSSYKAPTDLDGSVGISIEVSEGLFSSAICNSSLRARIRKREILRRTSEAC
jgi:hypothetical protein